MNFDKGLLAVSATLFSFDVMAHFTIDYSFFYFFLLNFFSVYFFPNIPTYESLMMFRAL